MGDVAGVVGMNEKQLKGSTAGLGFIYLRETAIDIKTYKSSNHHYRTICTPWIYYNMSQKLNKSRQVTDNLVTSHYSQSLYIQSLTALSFSLHLVYIVKYKLQLLVYIVKYNIKRAS